MLRIFTDFDGPIMDVSERYYQVYQDCLKEASEPDQLLTVLSKEVFWQLKRAQVPERQIGQISGLHDDQARRFAQLRRETVHSLAYLPYDRVIPGAIAALDRLRLMDCPLVLLTMRRASALHQVLDHHDLARFFPLDRRYCLPDHYLKAQDVVEKPRLMGQALSELPAASKTWVIGDTEADIAAAHAYQVPVIGVLSGIRDRKRLMGYNPSFIVENLAQAVETILRIERPSQVSVRP
jgi:phosphoglycolate phosphatase-like HAD superfamily hydrolase